MSLWPPWLVTAYEDNLFMDGDDDLMQIVTMEGTMQVGRTDWIIRGVKGELYPCKPDIFDATYEPVEVDGS